MTPRAPSPAQPSAPAGLSARDLKRAFKAREAAFDQPTRVRIHRAISWLARAEVEEKDLDARFLFLWIAFNAAYAQAFGFEAAERDLLNRFLAQLLGVDQERRLHEIVFSQYSGPVRILIENRFVFDPFWRALRDHDSSNAWDQKFRGSQKAALRALVAGETQTVLSIVFDRLYVLRNQLVHGGATWNGQVNRSQVRDGARLMESLVPAILQLMVQHPELDLGEIAYPVV